jgi:hypothetical protein
MPVAITRDEPSSEAAAQFTSEISNPELKGKGIEGGATFSVTGSEAGCNTEELKGTAAGAAFEEFEITPIHTECTAFGFASPKITGFGHYGETEPCSYRLKAEGTLDLVCPAGRDVTIEVGTTCIVHIPAQNNLGTITYTTEVREGKHDLKLDLDLTGITVTHTDLNFLCPFAGSGEVANATLEGQWTLWGEQ